MQQPRADNGQYISLEKFVMSLMDERFSGLRKEMAHGQKALELQALEYERRLKDLNHAHARAQEIQHTFLSVDKYEDQTEAADTARELALNRIDEQLTTLDKDFNQRLTDYMTRYEARQNEIDQALALGKGAADEAKRAAEEQGRKNNRNIGIASICLAVVIAVANWLGFA